MQMPLAAGLAGAAPSRPKQACGHGRRWLLLAQGEAGAAFLPLRRLGGNGAGNWDTCSLQSCGTARTLAGVTASVRAERRRSLRQLPSGYPPRRQTSGCRSPSSNGGSGWGRTSTGWFTAVESIVLIEPISPFGAGGQTSVCRPPESGLERAESRDRRLLQCAECDLAMLSIARWPLGRKR